VLIETIPAAFEMDEILYELRDHSAGLNAGRWDYLFSVIKKFRTGAASSSARAQLGHDDRAVHARLHRAAGQTCHRRGAHAMGGMAAFIPSRRDPEVNEKALAKVREDKTRESPTASTAPGSPTPTWSRSARRSSTASSARTRTSSPSSARTSASPPRTCSR
jgi:malate synthase A